jgi:hypothetical protein
MSFHGARTIGVAVPPAVAINWLCSVPISLGECSMSSSSHAKPERLSTSTVYGVGKLHHSPICGRPAAMARLN